MTDKSDAPARVAINKTGFEGVDDEALAVAMAQLNAGAWWEFDRRYAGKLKVFIAGQLRELDDEEHEQILQNALVRLSRGLPTYQRRSDASFAAWCFTVAKSECLDERRRRKGHPRRNELVSFAEVEQRYDSSVTAASDRLLINDEEQLEPLTEAETIFRAAFASLTALDQTVLQMSLYSPDSDQTIADVVQKPVSQIRMIRYKAKAKLKRACERLLASRRAS